MNGRGLLPRGEEWVFAAAYYPVLFSAFLVGIVTIGCFLIYDFWACGDRDR